MFRRIVVVSMIAGVLAYSVSCSREPDNHSDCIIQNVKPGMSDYAAAQVAAACREKFGHERDNATKMALVNLPDKATRDLTGTLGRSFGSTWDGNVYNRSENWQVEELQIRIAHPDWIWSVFDDFLEGEWEGLRSEKYLVNVSIPPLSNATFSLSVNWPQDEEYKWRIVSARGRQVR